MLLLSPKKELKMLNAKKTVVVILNLKLEEIVQYLNLFIKIKIYEIITNCLDTIVGLNGAKRAKAIKILCIIKIYIQKKVN